MFRFYGKYFVSAWPAGEGPLTDSLIDVGFIPDFEPLFPVWNDIQGSPLRVNQWIFSHATMEGSTGPAILFGAINHSRPYGVQLDVTDGRPEMLFIEDGRVRSRLPEMAFKFIFQIELGGIRAMAAMKGSGDRIFVLRNCYHVDMIRHQTISANPKAESLAASAQEPEVVFPVSLIAKDFETTDPALSNMERNSRQNYTRYSWHVL
jgi:hypothetical protein